MDWLLDKTQEWDSFIKKKKRMDYSKIDVQRKWSFFMDHQSTEFFSGIKILSPKDAQ